MFKKLIAHRILRLHLIAWLLYTAYFGTLIIYYNPDTSVQNFVIIICFYRIGDIVYFYLNSLWILPKYLHIKKIHILIPSFVISLVLYLSYRYLLDYYIFAGLGLKEKLPLNRSVSIAISQGGNFIIFSLGYYFSQRVIQQQKEIAQKDIEIANEKAVVAEQKLVLVKKEKQLAEEREKNAILAKEKAQAEMAFLRAQINPHFLFNSLNLIYSKILTSTKEIAAETMLEFSKMMQYATSTKMQEDTVDVSGELEFVKQFINLFKARNRQGAYIDFEVEGYFFSHRVVPMVLITMVENALKHGIIDDPSNPIIIRASLIDDFFVFMIRNPKNPYPNDVAGKGNTGVGIPNIIKRLDAVYKNGGFTLESEDLEEDYITTFTINYKLI